MAEAARREEVGWRHARVGLLILVALLIAAYAIFRVGDLMGVFESQYELVTFAPSANGLPQGAAITLAGQRVGQVKEIRFLRPGRGGENNLEIRMSVARDVAEHIRADSRVFMRTQGLLGDRFLDIQPGSTAARVLQPGDTVPLVPPTDLDEMLATAATALERANLILGNVAVMTSGLTQGEGTLGRLLTDDALYREVTVATREVRGIMAEVNGADGTLGRLIRDPALYQELRGAVARADSLGGVILAGEGTLGRLLRDDALYDEVLGAVRSADAAVAGMGDWLTGMRQGEGTLQRLLTDPALYDEFLKAIVDVQNLIADVRTNPRAWRPQVIIDIF
jgi:phospholipid/cholesterol/gamma-HCH transport system substrate-binding protein